VEFTGEGNNVRSSLMMWCSPLHSEESTDAPGSWRDRGQSLGSKGIGKELSGRQAALGDR
jgi:hypothetical protein